MLTRTNGRTMLNRVSIFFADNTCSYFLVAPDGAPPATDPASQKNKCMIAQGAAEASCVLAVRSND